MKISEKDVYEVNVKCLINRILNKLIIHAIGSVRWLINETRRLDRAQYGYSKGSKMRSLLLTLTGGKERVSSSLTQHMSVGLQLNGMYK